MSKVTSVTYKDKLLIHLRDYLNRQDDDLLPEEVTQEGIARGVNMSRTHVSRVAKDLTEEGFLKENLAHVKGGGRKLKTYTLTGKGIAAADGVISQLRDIRVIKDGVEKVMHFTEILEKGLLKADVLEAIELLESNDGVLNLDALEPKVTVRMLEEGPDVTSLYGRGELLGQIDDWFTGDTPVAVLYGSKGVGASSVARRFLDSVNDRHLLWVNITERSREEIEEKMALFVERTGKDGGQGLMDVLRESRALMVIDNYHKVKDDVVDMMRELVEGFGRDHELKVIITAREGTPVYERFYHMEHVEKGTVMEFKVNTLKGEEAQKVLGGPIESEALKGIMQMTKGSPLLLTLLREGDGEGIYRESPLTKGQISLLLYLKTQTRKDNS